MSEILDVPGASGARYRFRRTDLDALPATAGNILVLRPRKAGPELLLCAAVDSLAQARDAAAAALQGAPGAAVYIRLNVGRTARDAEQADIDAAAPGAADA
ncbi:hypothetical protein ACO2Q0_20735 [Phenylobacterium sp. VNQ135]|uniref:hypothetical protein n=1 Tax=Phenylobacterium sp. VNQ135 TaxID=3400922 RepID=UPI003BFDD77A